MIEKHRNVLGVTVLMMSREIGISVTVYNSFCKGIIRQFGDMFRKVRLTPLPHNQHIIDRYVNANEKAIKRSIRQYDKQHRK